MKKKTTRCLVLFMVKVMMTTLFIEKWVAISLTHMEDNESVLAVEKQVSDTTNSVRELIAAIMVDVDSDLHPKAMKAGERQQQKLKTWPQAKEEESNLKHAMSPRQTSEEQFPESDKFLNLLARLLNIRIVPRC